MGYILCDWHEVYVILHELRIKRGLLKKKVLLTLVVRSQRTSCTSNISKKTKIFYLPAKFSAYLLTCCDFLFFFSNSCHHYVEHRYIQRFRFRWLNALHIQNLSNCCKHNYDQLILRIFLFILFLAGFWELSILMYF